MLRRKLFPLISSEPGFTLVELLVVMILVGILFTSFTIFFTSYLSLYPAYQKDANTLSELAQQSQRVSFVLRGIVDINSEATNDLNAYAYFAPSDTYTSVIHYYLNGPKTALMADVTPMTANPPTGTPIVASKRTFTIISNYYQQPGVNLFTYYDITGAQLTPPIANEHTISSIGVNLSETATHTRNGEQLNEIVSLRNRKVNL